MAETLFIVGPADVKPPQSHDSLPCYNCGGTVWVRDRSYDWKSDGPVRHIRRPTTWKCSELKSL